MNLYLIAHSGESHADTTEAAWHVLFSSQWLATPLGLLAMATVIFLIHKLINNSTVTYVVALLLLLSVGMFTYTTLPVLSTICIVTGFILALASVLFGLGGQ